MSDHKIDFRDGRSLGRSCRSMILVVLAMSPMAGFADVGDAVTIASGLSNPRGINFAPNGALYVAEAGRGGAGPCIPSPSQPAMRCYGETGSVTEILPDGSARRLLTGLPSLILPNGIVEGGVVDVAFLGTAAYAVLGLAGDPAFRPTLGGNAGLLGQMIKVTPSGQYQVLADIAGFEAQFNPAGGTIDSNPYGILPLPGRRIIADAGANTVIEVLANGKTRTFAIPPALANGQSVPTAVIEGPDGAIYVSLLTPFPFFAGAAQVLRYSSDGSSSETYAAGLTAIVDITFDNGGALYILEIASGQSPPFPPPNPGLGIGRLLRQCPNGSRAVLLSGLTFPGGVAIGPDDAAYLTNFGTSPGSGEVLRLSVAPCAQ